MKRVLFRSIEELTQPDVFSKLVQEQVTTVCLKPFETAGWSTTDSDFLSIDGCHIESPRYIIKRVKPKQDWSMQTTEDWHGRFVANWRHGLLDRLPDEIEHGVIACFDDEDGYGLLMHNLAHALLPDGEITEQDHVSILDGMAALHAAFWQDKVLSDSRLNLCPPQLLFTFTSAHKIRKIAEKLPSGILKMILEGWSHLPSFVEQDLIDHAESLLLDPTPFCSALAKYPQTLVHGDFWQANLGIERGDRTKLIILDWSRPAATVPAYDLLYYLMLSASSGSPISKEQSISLYKEKLAYRLGDHYDEAWWLPQLELSYLGVYALLIVFKAHFAVNSDDETQLSQALSDLEWWSEKARTGLKWLDGLS